MQSRHQVFTVVAFQSIPYSMQCLFPRVSTPTRTRSVIESHTLSHFLSLAHSLTRTFTHSHTLKYTHSHTITYT